MTINENNDLLNALLKINECNPYKAIKTFTKLMNKHQCVELAVFSVESILPIFENKHPHINIPRKAIEATKNYLKNPSNENKRIVKETTKAALKLSRDMWKSNIFLEVPNSTFLEGYAFDSVQDAVMSAAEAALAFDQDKIIFSIDQTLWAAYINSHAPNAKTLEDVLDVLNAVTNNGYEMKKLGETIIHEAVRILKV